MADNTYFLWDIKAKDTIRLEEALVRTIAQTEQDALEKAKSLLPERQYTIVAVCEYWLPGIGIESVVKAIEKASTS